MFTQEQVKLFYKNWLKLNDTEMAKLLNVSPEELSCFLSAHSDSLAFRKIVYAEVLDRTQEELLNLQVQYFLSKNHGHMGHSALEMDICPNALRRRVKVANLNKR